MLCKICNKNVATIHYKSNNNGKITETYLCNECAAKNGSAANGVSSLFEPVDIIDDVFEIHGGLFDGLFGSMIGDKSEEKKTTSGACPVCGMRFTEFLQGSKIGCSKCYEIFCRSLEPTVKRIHGNVEHCGKVPEGASMEEKNFEKQIASLEEKLKKAIETQEYEKAAEYRDKIKELKENGGKEEA